MAPHKTLQAERLSPEVWCLAGRAKRPGGFKTKPRCPLESTDGFVTSPSRIRIRDLRSRRGPAVQSVQARDPQGMKGNAIRPFRVDPAGGRGVCRWKRSFRNPVLDRVREGRTECPQVEPRSGSVRVRTNAFPFEITELPCENRIPPSGISVNLIFAGGASAESRRADLRSRSNL